LEVVKAWLCGLLSVFCGCAMYRQFTNAIVGLMRRVLDPPFTAASSCATTYAAVDAGALHVRRLEERRVMAGNILGESHFGAGSGDTALGGEISTMAQPAITAPASQSIAEGATLVFSPAAGREIRIDAPGLGAGPLRVDINALDSLGQVTPILGFGTTAGLAVTGNGVNVFQLQGTLPSVNAALASLTFYSLDNGDFTINLVATDALTGENDSATIDVNVVNVAPLVNVPFAGDAVEGANIEVPIQLFDPGAVDNPQISWTVSNGAVVVASGAGAPVRFFAPDDGVYALTVTALDKDGGVNVVTENVFVQNANPGFALSGVMQNRVVNLSIVINDPGHELFAVEVYWTSGATTAETIFTYDRVLSFSHQYTPEELAQAGELTIAVQVSDNRSFARQTLQFREGEPISAERPEFAARPEETPPERTISARAQVGGTTSQIVSADLGRALTHGTQAAPALHQFVLRVVSPDGEESENYPLPGEALANLPAYLTSLGVPDGHYRVYLVTGELERLVIDGHLRAGRIVDPTNEWQGGFDFASHVPANISEIAAPDPAAVPIPNGAPEVPISITPVLNQNGEQSADVAMPIADGAIIISAASTILSTTVSHQDDKRNPPKGFYKRARLARKLARHKLLPARV
jgi:hypothetical protein